MSKALLKEAPVTYEKRSLVGIPFSEQVTAVADGVHPIRVGIMAAISQNIHHQQVSVFLENTPDGKVGEELYREFARRRNLDGTAEGYDFVSFIREVIKDVSEAKIVD